MAEGWRLLLFGASGAIGQSIAQHVRTDAEIPALTGGRRVDAMCWAGVNMARCPVESPGGSE